MEKAHLKEAKSVSVFTCFTDTIVIPFRHHEFLLRKITSSSWFYIWRQD